MSDREERGRLPPNQALAAEGRWPVVGERAPRGGDDRPWRVSVEGLVTAPRSWSLEELEELEQVERAVDIHCVTRWSKLGVHFGGVPLSALLGECRPLSEARFISFVARSGHDHSTSVPLADALALGTLVALRSEGRPLETIHGGPVRTVTPGRYFYKSLKWLERIELLAEDRLGYWEADMGYHNEADPWREQRYVAANVDRREARRLLESRDLAGRDLLSLEAGRRDLAGLDARRALLRNAWFQEAKLAGARFDGANLSNAHLEGAQLVGASFRDADLEGADFRGADLRGADFRGASLFGATFCPEPGDASGRPAALVDRTTRISRDQLDGLSEAQQEFLERRLAATPS